MKTLSSNLLRAFVVIVLFTGGSIALSTTGIKTVNEAQARVTETQVIDYLEEYGYLVVSLAPKAGTVADWKAHTIKNGIHYWTTIRVCGNEINDHSDSMIFY